jgi:hypothetical protein
MELAFPNPGIPAASAIPSTDREPMRPDTVLVSPVDAPATDHTSTAMPMPAFKPMRSMNNPAAGATTAYKIEKTERI